VILCNRTDIFQVIHYFIHDSKMMEWEKIIRIEIDSWIKSDLMNRSQIRAMSDSLLEKVPLKNRLIYYFISYPFKGSNLTNELNFVK